MKVYLVLVDGLGFHHLTPEWTDEARWVVPLRNQLPSITAPNWASILSGVKPAVHHVMDNKNPRIFGDRTTLLHDTDRPVQVVSDWVAFRHLTPGLPFYHDKSPLRHWFKYRADVVLFNLDRLDSRAHAFGWKSTRATATRTRMARELSRIRAQISENYIMLVVADHGGFRKNHEAPQHAEVRTVPLILYSNMQSTPPQPRIRTTTSIRKWLKKVLQK